MLKITTEAPGKYLIPGQQRHGLGGYTVEPDASAASYFLGGGRNHRWDGQRRGSDNAKAFRAMFGFVDMLEEMGCSAIAERESGSPFTAARSTASTST